MSTEFPKNKGKRSRSSSNEANNSFLKNVTSRVSGLLPATISRWFSSPSSSFTNGSAPVADTDSSTDDEAAPDPITSQPPAKRARYVSDAPHTNHYGLNDTNHISYTAEPSTSYSPGLASPSRRVEPFIREPTYSTTPLRPLQDEHLLRSQMSFSEITETIEKKRNSLFGSVSPSIQHTTMISSVRTSLNTVKDPTQPCFKPSLLSSPFYSGRTMYGGASSSYLNQSNVKLQKVAVVNETSYANNTVSHQARKVMDLLEHYSSPLAEARRLSQYSRSEQSARHDESLDPDDNSMMLNRIKSYMTRELHVPSVASYLRIKQRSRLSRATSAARQMLASRSSTSEQRPAPAQAQRPAEAQAQRPAEAQAQLYSPRASAKESSSKFTAKLKSRLTRQNRGESNDANEMPTPLNLPSGGLQLDGGKLPVISYGSSMTSTPKPATAPAPPSVITPNPAKRTAPKRPKTAASEEFTFASPIRISSEQDVADEPPQFFYLSPDRSVAKGVCGDGRTEPPHLAARDWTCDDCWVTNKPSAPRCVSCGGAKPSTRPAPRAKTPECSVCKFAPSQSHGDKCINCEKAQTKRPSKIGGSTQSCKLETIPSLSNHVDKSSVDSSPGVEEWRCGDCWVMNKPASLKCVACGGAKPTPAAAAASSTHKPTTNAVPSKPLTNNIAMPEASKDWKCDDCWVTNKHKVIKCVACGGARPGAAPAPSSSPAKFDYSGISGRVPPAKWECSSCLVRNEHNKTKCVCCEADKPGVDKPAAGAAKFDFGVSPNMFKFGINHATTVEISKAETIKTAVETNKVESETNNNVVPKATFSFGVPTSKDKTATAAASSKEETGKSPKVGFTFGIPAPKAQNADATPGNFSFSTSIMKTPSAQPKLDTDKDKEQVVPKLPTEEVKTAQETSKATLNMFSSTFTPPASSEKTNTLTTFLVSTASNDKKEASRNPLTSNPPTTNSLTSNPLANNPLTSNPLTSNALTSSPLTSNPLTLASVTTTATSQPAFGAGNKLNNMFASTAATSSAVAFTLPASPAAPVAALSAGAAPPLFGAPTSGGLFQKSEAPVAAAPAAPLFTLGGTTQADSKPKFNFTFGKTEPSAMFKPPFGTTDQKFTLLSSGTGATETAAPASLAALPASVFGAPKESMWLPQPPAPAAAAATMFVTSTPLNATSKPPFTPPFTFGSSSAVPPSVMPFPAAGGSQTFGSTSAFSATAASSPPRPFGGSAPPFGAGAGTNVFGMSNPVAGANGQASLFSSPSSLFGSPPTTVSASAAPAAGMFGSLASGAAPTFGAAPAASMSSLTPSATPPFNFGAQQQIFGFGQSTPPATQSGVYNFGVAPNSGAVQFNMGSGMSPLGQPTTAVRKIRKATRRANLR